MEVPDGVTEPGAPGAAGGGQPSPPPPLPPAAGDGTLDPAEDLDVLFPDRELAVRDPDTGESVTLTVREYRFLDGLAVRRDAAPLFDALANVMDAPGGAEVRLGAVEHVFASHLDEWLCALSVATGRPPEWIGALRDADADALTDVWWTVCGPFVMRRVLARLQAIPSLSPQSSTSSSEPATDGAPKISDAG